MGIVGCAAYCGGARVRDVPLEETSEVPWRVIFGGSGLKAQRVTAAAVQEEFGLHDRYRGRAPRASVPKLEGTANRYSSCSSVQPADAETRAGL